MGVDVVPCDPSLSLQRFENCSIYIVSFVEVIIRYQYPFVVSCTDARLVSRVFMLLVTRYPSSPLAHHLVYFLEEWNRLSDRPDGFN